MLFIFNSLCKYHLILFSKVIICILLNICVKNHEKIFCNKEFMGYMFICQNSEGLPPCLLKCCRDTCTFVGMLKGCMVRKRLVTPVLLNKKMFRKYSRLSLFTKCLCAQTTWFRGPHLVHGP